MVLKSRKNIAGFVHPGAIKMNKYVNAPDCISFTDCQKNNFKLSPSLYAKFAMKNNCSKPVFEFLSRKLSNSDLGIEIGSLSYIDKSTHYFLRTKALQEHSFIPQISRESALSMRPADFENMNLKKGDLLISKDSNIGEIVILDKDYPNYMPSSAIYRLPVENKWKYYLLAMLKHDVFREQLDAVVPKGATIRHAKTMFLNCLIPLPKKNEKKIVEFVSILTKAIVEKEILIQKRYEKALNLIENELQKNQKKETFFYRFPMYSEIIESKRLDASLYSEYFQKEIFKIKNYKNGSRNIYELGYDLSRGQNLQISNIGHSIYATEHEKNFYTLMLPKFLSKYGTIEKIEYLGNKNFLKTLKQGDLIFGAEGFEKGRSIVVLEEQDKVITNIHGITIQHLENDINLSIFVKLFLDYLRKKGLIDLYAVGGNGGSLAKKYWDSIPFPVFPKEKQLEIVRMYHNCACVYNYGKFTLDNFIAEDSLTNASAGIYELDKSLKHLKGILNKTIEKIVDDEDVKIDFVGNNA